MWEFKIPNFKVEMPILEVVKVHWLNDGLCMFIHFVVGTGVADTVMKIIITYKMYLSVAWLSSWKCTNNIRLGNSSILKFFGWKN